MKYKLTMLGVISGLILYFLNCFFISQEWFFISVITNFLPKSILGIIFGSEISYSMVMYGFWITVLIYPILLGIIGLIIDLNKPKKKANKKITKKKKH